MHFFMHDFSLTQVEKQSREIFLTDLEVDNECPTVPVLAVHVAEHVLMIEFRVLGKSRTCLVYLNSIL